MKGGNLNHEKGKVEVYYSNDCSDSDRIADEPRRSELLRVETPAGVSRTYGTPVLSRILYQPSSRLAIPIQCLWH